MARIRTIKPEFWQSKKLAKCSPHARLLAIALLQLCDRNGVFLNIPMQVHAHAFPHEASVNTAALLGELEAIDYLQLYSVGDKDYGYLPGFVPHQRISGKEAQSEGMYPLPNQADSEGENSDASPGSDGEAEGKAGKRKEERGKRKEGARKARSISLDDFLSECKAQGVLPIPEDDPIFTYSEKAGIPLDFVELAWREFMQRYREAGKKQVGINGWRETFRKCVRGNWYKLWWANPDGQYALTTTGVQARKVHAA